MRRGKGKMVRGSKFGRMRSSVTSEDSKRHARRVGSWT